MNIKVDLKKLFAAAVSAIMCLSAGGCYLLPDEEEVLDAPTVKASDVTYSTVTAKKKDLVFIASEEAAILAMEPEAEDIYAPAGGEPVIVRVKEGY